MSEPRRRAIRPGELLAVDPKSIQAGPEAFFWLFAAPIAMNERCGPEGDIAVVRINGPMEHHRDAYADSYESILERVRDAMTGEDVAKADAMAHQWDDDYQPADAAPPRAVVLRIDSPGGVVSGLNECVRSLAKLKAEHGLPLVAYIDEMAASAAYALCCACDEVALPPSGIAGSIGVISTMVSQVERDKKDGLEFRILTSGARKADGHVHAPISDAAVAAETKRVERLAGQYFKMVEGARGISVAQVRSYEAGIFLGRDAVKASLANVVSSWDDFLADLDSAQSGTTGVAGPGGSGNVTPTRATLGGTTRHSMNATLSALIRQTKAQIASETDAIRKADLTKALGTYEASLAAYKKANPGPASKTTKVIEHKEKHTSDDPPPPDGDDDGGDDSEDEEESEEEGGNETDRSDTPGSDEEDEEEEEAEEEEAAASSEEEESEEESKKSAKKVAAALYSVARKATGRKGSAVVGALSAIVAKAERHDALAKDVAALKAGEASRKRDAAIDVSLARKCISPAEAKTLRTKKPSFVTDYLSMRTKPLVSSVEGGSAQPNGRAAQDVDPQAMEMIEAAVQASGAKGAEAQAALRAQLVLNHREGIAARANGAGSRY